MVWINEVPRHEMNVDDELTLRCGGSWAKELELRLRREIYQWNHMPGDMVVSDFIECPMAIHSTDFGITEDVDVVKTDDASDIVSRRFNVQIREPGDLEKIRMPKVILHGDVTDLSYQLMSDLFMDIIPVRKAGQAHIWYTPWDYLVRWWGIQEAIMDLVIRQEMVHDGVEKLVQAWMTELDRKVHLLRHIPNLRFEYRYVRFLRFKNKKPLTTVRGLQRREGEKCFLGYFDVDGFWFCFRSFWK